MNTENIMLDITVQFNEELSIWPDIVHLLTSANVFGSVVDGLE